MNIMNYYTVYTVEVTSRGHIVKNDSDAVCRIYQWAIGMIPDSTVSSLLVCMSFSFRHCFTYHVFGVGDVPLS